MNSKKLTALLCAAAIASSTLVPVMASAEETANLSEATVLWSDTFDSYENVTTGEHSIAGLPVLAYTTTGPGVYEGIGGLTIKSCTRPDSVSGDDTSYVLVEPANEGDDANISLKTNISRFSTENRGSSFTFTEAYAPTDELALIVSSKIKIDAGESTYAPAFMMGNILISATKLYGEGGEDNVWADVKLIYYPDSTYEVEVNGTVVDNGTTTPSFQTINFSALDATGTSLGNASTAKAASYHTIWFDDMVIYNTTMDEVADPAPAAETRQPVEVATPEPTEEVATPVPEAAPKAVVPDNATTVADQNFDEVEDVTYSLGTESTHQEIGDISIHIGGRGGGGTAETYAKVLPNVDTDKMLKVASGRYGNAARAPYITLNTDIEKSHLVGEETYAALTFAAKLITGTSHPATIHFLKDLTTNGDKGIYQNIAATITTDEAATSGIIVTPDEWHVIEFLMWADGSAMVVVDGAENNIGSVSALPIIATTNADSSTVVNTSVEFDNIVAYVDGEFIVPDVTPEPQVPAVDPIPETVVDFTQDMSGLAADYVQKLGTEAGTYTDIDGLTYVIGGRADGVSGDTTAVSAVTDSYENQYLYVKTGTYGTNGRAPRFEVTGAPTLAQLATDEDYVAVSFAAMLIPNGDTPATIAFPADTQFSTNGGYYVFNAGTLTTGEVAEDSTTEAHVDANTWVVVDVIVYKTGAYSISVDGSEVITGTTIGSSGGGSDKVTLTALPYITTNSSKNVTNASFAIDNIVAVHTGELSAVATPVPTAEPVAAPAVNAVDNTTVIFAENFNGLETSSTRMSATESLTVEAGANVKVSMGSRDGESSNEPQYTSVNIKENVEADNVLNLTGGKFGTATRAPKVSLVNSPSIADLEGEDDFIAMGFAFKLNPVSGASSQTSALTLIANADDTVKLDENGENTNTETKDEGNVYGYVYGAFTSNEADAVEGSVAYVEPDEWHTAEITIYSDGEWYVTLDGVDVFTGNGLAYSNGDKVPTTKLPQLVAAKNKKGDVTYPNVDIDNMIVYTSAVPTLANVAITAATAEAATITADVDTTAKVIVATYDADGRVVSTATQIVNLVAGENTVPVAAAAGDVVMAWTAYNNQGMQPYCAPVVVQ